MPRAPQHRVTVQIAGMKIDGWTSYKISSSMLTPADSFTLTRPFDAEIYLVAQTDVEVTILVDDVPILTGYIDDTEKETSRDTSTMTISGRDKVGRLTQESAPRVAYDGIDLVEVVRRLADPWFKTVSPSDARNRLVRLGKKGRKAAAGTEPLVLKVKKKTWQVEPGQTRWQIISTLASEAGYLVWSSSDGKELIIGQPNYTQAVQYIITNPEQSELSSSALRLNIRESVGDRFSLVMALGAGRGDAVNYGENAVTRRDVVRNGPNADGTGLDFLRPKRLILAERTLINIEEARQYAAQEMARRDFNKRQVAATMPGHGQVVTAGAGATLFTYNTIARVVDQEQDPVLDLACLVYACEYSGSRDAETTELSLVPSGTVFVQ